MLSVDLYHSQQEVNNIIYDAIDLFWNDYLLSDVHTRYFQKHPPMPKFLLIQKMFIKASSLMPIRLDLRYSAAFFMISQGKIEQAIEVYKEICELYPNALNARILECVYTKIIKGNQLYEERMNEYYQNCPEKVLNFKNAVSRAEQYFQITYFQEKSYVVSQNKSHCIVVLGFMLNNDGSMKNQLINRLKKCQQQYHMNPNSRVILSGGFPKHGRTESYMMMNWLLHEGIPADRLILEQRSKDTLGNALYVVPKLQQIGAQVVTLISSSSHMRRALLLFETVSRQKNYFPHFSTLVDPDADISSVSKSEQLAILRDVIRAEGIWAIPGIFK